MQNQGEPKKADSSYVTEGHQLGSREGTNQEARPGFGAPLLERIVAFIGLVLVSGSIGFLAYQAVTRDSSPPDVMFNIGSITTISNGYLVKFQAINKGNSTAKGLIVEGQLKNDNEEIETSETALDYLPSHSAREGGLFFTKDPRQFELQLRALGYEQP
jgi:uncharacterized protein (TIGR02588 family)